jgi:hypothetical protein
MNIAAESVSQNQLIVQEGTSLANNQGLTVINVKVSLNAQRALFLVTCTESGSYGVVWFRPFSAKFEKSKLGIRSFDVANTIYMNEADDWHFRERLGVEA